MSTILLIVLVLLLIGAFPNWPYSATWGYYPSGILGLVLLIVIILVLLGQLQPSFMDWWHRVAASREPDFVIGQKYPYLRRWWLIPRNRFFNIYLHQFLLSDDDRALHDHMYMNLSYILEGSYVEHTIAQGGVNHQKRYVAGCLRFRMPSTAHRIEIERPCWSLFITGPRVREWGFHCPKGWRSWREFVDDRDYGKVGRGCED